MALRAFHLNPGIGGFGEGTTTLSTNFHFDKKTKCQAAEHSSKDADDDNFDSNNKLPKYNSNGHGDLICQIVKELVDNAADACRYDHHEREGDGCNSSNNSNNNNNHKRIVVDIRPPQNDPNNDSILQVTVSDNGCGIENVQDCVNAFHSSKRGGDEEGDNSNNNSSNSKNYTSGRYGIGLTLCILHAQRCVPNSRVCITSVSAKSKYRTRAIFEVDKQGDSVECVQEELTPVSTMATDSSNAEFESGTCVSLLVPGRMQAKLAWPRLNDYFNRFRLSTNLQFELHIFAPTLTTAPIFIRRSYKNMVSASSPVHGKFRVEETARAIKGEIKQPQQNNLHQHFDVDDDDDDDDDNKWGDLFDDVEEDDGSADDGNCTTNENLGACDEERISREKDENERNINKRLNSISEVDSDRFAFFEAAKSFWSDRKIVYKNVARSVRKISTRSYNQTENTSNPELQVEVSLVVCPYSKHSNDTSKASSTSSMSSLDGAINQIDTDDYCIKDKQTATLQLIRMVNGNPVLDSGEAHSCGIVHGVADKSLWGSFGLDITKNSVAHQDDSETSLHHTTYALQDSSIIAPFINRNNNHRQLRTSNRDTVVDNDDGTCNKKRNNDSRDDLLPVNLRIGSILVVVQICAASSLLPLPTLSKGRLPLNHRQINSALHLGLRDCLMKLKTTNPELFLTSTHLRAIERDVRYVPGVASAISRIVCRSANNSLKQKCLEVFQNVCVGDSNTTGKSKPGDNTQSDKIHESSKHNASIDVRLLADAFQARIRIAMHVRNNLPNSKRRKKQKDITVNNEEEYGDFDSWDGSKDSSETSRQSIDTNHQDFVRLEMGSAASYDQSFTRCDASSSSCEVYSNRKSITRPLQEILIKNETGGSDNVTKEIETLGDDFDDW